MINRLKLTEELTKGFIAYLWALENPFTSKPTEQHMFNQYRSNWLFNRKVDSMVAGVLRVVDEAEETPDDNS